VSVLVDSNVLLDVLTEDQIWFSWSSETLARVGRGSALVVDPMIYAEVSVRFESIEELEDALPASTFRRDPIPYDAAFLAGRAFLLYRRRGGTKTTLLPDFYIGAHAAVAGYQLLTRDAKRYRTYFPTVELIAP
jgi:predicted nucleic acid-binding protein